MLGPWELGASVRKGDPQRPLVCAPCCPCAHTPGRGSGVYHPPGAQDILRDMVRESACSFFAMKAGDGVMVAEDPSSDMKV